MTMGKKCNACIGAEVKDALRLLNKPDLDQALEQIPDCDDSMGIELCVKKPRSRSEYQVFISECMKSKPIKGKPFGAASEYMKECAVAWRRRKEEKANG